MPLPGIRDCAYAHGGHLIAANSGNTVTLLDAHTLQRLANLFGHLAPVTSLAWAADDSAFTTGGADGMYYTWSVEKLARVHEARCYRGAAITGVAVLSEPRASLDHTGDDLAAKAGVFAGTWMGWLPLVNFALAAYCVKELL